MKKLLVFSLLLLSACGQKSVDGTYHGATNLTFKDGKVETMMFGQKTETPYQMDGNKIKFRFQGGSNVVLTRNEDGSLSGGILGTFKK